MPLPRTWNLYGEDHVPYQLLLLAKLIERDTASQMQFRHGRTLAEWRVLAFVCSSGPSSASDIGNAADIDRAEISRAVAKLISAGLIERTPSASNRRRLIISPTPLGTDEYLKIRAERRTFFRGIMAGIPKSERLKFREHLQSIAELVDAQQSHPEPSRERPEAANS